MEGWQAWGDGQAGRLRAPRLFPKELLRGGGGAGRGSPGGPGELSGRDARVAWRQDSPGRSQPAEWRGGEGKVRPGRGRSPSRLGLLRVTGTPVTLQASRHSRAMGHPLGRPAAGRDTRGAAVGGGPRAAGQSLRARRQPRAGLTGVSGPRNGQPEPSEQPGDEHPTWPPCRLEEPGSQEDEEVHGAGTHGPRAANMGWRGSCGGHEHWTQQRPQNRERKLGCESKGTYEDSVPLTGHVSEYSVVDLQQSLLFSLHLLM